MRYLRRVTKYNIILLAAIVFALVCPTVVTFVLAKKTDKVDKKSQELVFSASKTDEDTIDEVVPDETAQSDEVINTGKLAPEIDKREANHLTDNGYDGDEEETVVTATNTDASATDAAEVEEELIPGEPNGKKVYLTFDDGPSSNTPEILDILRKYGVKATFFVVKNTDNDEYLKQIADEGHTIGMHSACHVYNRIYSSMASFKSDVKGVHDWIKSVTGIDSKFYRFPGGSSYGINGFSKEKGIRYLEKMGYTYIDWNAENFDAKNPYLAPATMNAKALDFIRSNEGDSVLLMHDQEGRHNTVESLPELIETLIREGYEICPIDENAPTFHQYMTEAEKAAMGQEGY